MSRERWTPCQRNPERWFSDNRREQGRAVHECLSHCARLVECEATEARPVGGVLAGRRYVSDGYDVVPEKRVLHEVPCDECGEDPKPKPAPTDPTDTGACGEPRGYHRHISRNQRPCDPCHEAKTTYQREQWRAWRDRVRGAA